MFKREGNYLRKCYRFFFLPTICNEIKSNSLHCLRKRAFSDLVHITLQSTQEALIAPWIVKWNKDE
jgi:hypothetical protein